MRNSHEFDDFYAGSVRRVSGYVFALTGDRGETEDVVQEAYARTWQNWNRVGTYEDPEGWVRTVAYRIQVSRWRRATAGLKAHRRHGAAGNVPELSVDYVAIVSALRKVTASQRRAIVLYYLVGLSVEEISRETGVASGTVKSQLSRARARLAVLLSESGEYHGNLPAYAREASSRA